MSTRPNADDSLVISYLALRKAIGVLGISLPFVTSIGARIIFHQGMQDSISSYYYTGMRDVFVGMLWAIGVFLGSYKGYERKDSIAGNLACIFALGVSLFPTSPGGDASPFQDVIGHIHLTCAALLFSTLAYFSLFLFTKTNAGLKMTFRKRQRNSVYRVCGTLMVLCILLMLLDKLLPGVSGSLAPLNPIFWLEAIAIVSFGISWLTKGEAILGD